MKLSPIVAGIDLLGPALQFVKCLLLWLVGAIEVVLIGLVNLLVAGLAGLIGLVLAALPTFDLGSAPLPSSAVTGLSYANHWLPVAFGLGLATIVLTVEVVWWLASVALRWARAVS